MIKICVALILKKFYGSYTWVICSSCGLLGISGAIRSCNGLAEEDKNTLSKKLGNCDDFSALSRRRGTIPLSALESGNRVAEKVLGLLVPESR